MRDESAFSPVVAVVVGSVGIVGGITWVGARLAVVLSGGRRFDAGIVDGVGAAARLPGHLGDPAGAWPAPAAGSLPGPGPYWAATGLVAVAVAAALAGVAGVWRRFQRVGTTDRDRLGVDARARMATARDLRTLFVREPVPGRFVLGRFRTGFRQRLVATEYRSADRRVATRGRPRRPDRRGDTGAVALIGPTRSGKTVAAVAGILEWEGPAVLSSVKADLLAATIGWRARRGEVRIYDPLGLTGCVGSSWSPLGDSRSITGARRGARNLLEATIDGSADELAVWKNLAEFLVAGYFWVAATAGRGMDDVVEWVLTQGGPVPETRQEVDYLLRRFAADRDPEVAADAARAAQYLRSIWDQHDRSRSAVYGTAQVALTPFSDPAIAQAARISEIDLDWLMSGENTVYVCSPLDDQVRLASAFGGLLNDLLSQMYKRAIRSPDGRLDRRILVVVDEAGNQQLDRLPEFASTISGLGVQLVTIWQSVAQITSAYGAKAGIVLTNHLSKLFYTGLSDEDTLAYVANVVGEEEIEARQLSGDWAALRRGQVTDLTSRVGLVQAHCLRQMVPGDALLLHGTLPPAHVRTRRYFAERSLRDRASLPAPPALISDRPPVG